MVTTIIKKYMKYEICSLIAAISRYYNGLFHSVPLLFLSLIFLRLLFSKFNEHFFFGGQIQDDFTQETLVFSKTLVLLSQSYCFFKLLNTDSNYFKTESVLGKNCS